jgi:ribosomal protein S18 acetylase RimI-like enzyme
MCSLVVEQPHSKSDVARDAVDHDLRMEIRRCRRTDLAALEWDGQYTHDRAIIDRAYARTRERTAVMLVAVEGGEHVGQLWIDLARAHDLALIWAVRVKPAWRRCGIATRLLERAEQLIAGRGISGVEIEVEPANLAARRLYERRGYVHVRSELARAADSGPVIGAVFDVLRKPLREGSTAC